MINQVICWHWPANKTRIVDFAKLKSPHGEDRDSRPDRWRPNESVFELPRLEDWRAVLLEGPVRPIQWFVYYNDVTALKVGLEAGGDLSSLDLDGELDHAACFGHWKLCD